MSLGDGRSFVTADDGVVISILRHDEVELGAQALGEFDPTELEATYPARYFLGVERQEDLAELLHLSLSIA